MPAYSLPHLIDLVYEAAGQDDFDRRTWTRRQVGFAINRALEHCRSLGIKFQSWNAAAVTLSAGTVDYLYTHSPTISTASIADLEILEVRRTSDGQTLRKWEASELERLREGNPSIAGPVTDFAAYHVIETGVASGTDSGKIRLRVYPAPETGTTETLDVLVRGAEGFAVTTVDTGFSENTVTSGDIDIPNSIHNAVQQWAAGFLMGSDTWMAQADETLRDFAAVIYHTTGAGDIVLTER